MYIYKLILVHILFDKHSCIQHNFEVKYCIKSSLFAIFIHIYIHVRDWCTHFKHSKPLNRMHKKIRDIKKKWICYKNRIFSCMQTFQIKPHLLLFMKHLCIYPYFLYFIHSLALYYYSIVNGYPFSSLYSSILINFLVPIHQNDLILSLGFYSSASAFRAIPFSRVVYIQDQSIELDVVIIFTNLYKIHVSN